MKKSILFFITGTLLLFLFSCKFQQILKKGDIDQKYEMAMKLYEQKDYSRALQLFEPLIAMMKATDKAQKLYYCYAYSYYYQKDYTLAGYYFKRFTSNFPNTKEAEECAYMSAYCNYMNSPDYQLDQTSTYDALKDLQLFINTYPTSSRVNECNDLIDKLRVKLEYKDYKIARMYYRMSDYLSAITCFNNILKDYTDSPHKEEVLYLVVKSCYKYAEQSIETKKKERYMKTITSYNDLVSQYPESHYIQEAKEFKVKAESSLELLNKQSIINLNKISYK